MPDFTGLSFPTGRNLNQMCFNKTTPSQSKLYKELIEGKEHLLHSFDQDKETIKKDDDGPKGSVVGDSGSGSTNQTYTVDEDIVEELDQENSKDNSLDASGDQDEFKNSLN